MNHDIHAARARSRRVIALLGALAGACLAIITMGVN